MRSNVAGTPPARQGLGFALQVCGTCTLQAVVDFRRLRCDISSLLIHMPTCAIAILVADPVGEIAPNGFVAAPGSQVEVHVSTDEEFVAAAVGRIGVENGSVSIFVKHTVAGAFFTHRFAECKIMIDLAAGNLFRPEGDYFSREA